MLQRCTGGFSQGGNWVTGGQGQKGDSHCLTLYPRDFVPCVPTMYALYLDGRGAGGRGKEEAEQTWPVG